MLLCIPWVLGKCKWPHKNLNDTLTRKKNETIDFAYKVLSIHHDGVSPSQLVLVIDNCLCLLFIIEKMEVSFFTLFVISWELESLLVSCKMSPQRMLLLPSSSLWAGLMWSAYEDVGAPAGVNSNCFEWWLTNTKSDFRYKHTVSLGEIPF